MMASFSQALNCWALLRPLHHLHYVHHDLSLTRQS
jgi:hypothetical protein